MRVIYRLATRWATVVAMVFHSAAWAEPNPECVQPGMKLLKAKGTRLLVSATSDDGDKVLPLKIYVAPNQLAYVVVGHRDDSCIRYQLTNWKWSDGDVESLLKSAQPECRENTKTQVEGVPDCDTVRDLSAKLKQLNLRYLMEGTVSNATARTNSAAPMRLQLGFCRPEEEKEGGAYLLCIENIYLRSPSKPR